MIWVKQKLLLLFCGCTEPVRDDVVVITAYVDARIFQYLMKFVYIAASRSGVPTVSTNDLFMAKGAVCVCQI